MKQTTITKKEDIKRDWYLINAEDLVLGRLSTTAANILRGKNKKYFVNNMDCGDNLIITNARKILLSKDKINKKFYYNHSGFIGGMRKRNAKEMIMNYPVEMVTRSIKGMLPKNKLRDLQILRLHVYEGNEHKHSAQKVKEIKF